MKAASIGLLGLLAAIPASADEPFHVSVPVRKLAFTLLNLYGPNGLVVDSLARLPSGATHSAHFNSDFQTGFTQFSTALTSQLASVPLPSPASGLTYTYDSDLGVFQRSTQSFGPILAERAETIGRNRFSIGFSYQRLSFDNLEGFDLANLPAVFTHDSAELRGGREDLVITENAIEASVSQFTTFLTYGVSDRVDLSIAIPIVATDLNVVSSARVVRIGTTDEAVHFFRGADGSMGTERVFDASGSATGLGDVTVRVKGTVSKKNGRDIALGVDLRIPTGDEEDLLGSGATGVKPFFVLSTSYKNVSPHVNVGYLWNGSSVLAGNLATGETSDLPDQAHYAVGVDIGVNARFTVAFDILGQWLIESPRVVRQEFRALNGQSVFPNIGFETDTFNETNGAVGFKLNLGGNVLVDFNVLFKLNDNGLRDKVTPLFGFEYSFD